jgi:REP element-mobilizing transposase RayT
LPGDSRGWTDRDGGIRAPNHRLVSRATSMMQGRPLQLSPGQRAQVEELIRRHCAIRGWSLHAVACRTQHVHVVLISPEVSPAKVCQQLKAWSARMLHESGEATDRIWSRGYSGRRLYDARALAAVVQYVAECQDRPHAPR